MAVVAGELQGGDALPMSALISPQTLPRLHPPHLQGTGAETGHCRRHCPDRALLVHRACSLGEGAETPAEWKQGAGADEHISDSQRGAGS